MLDELNNEQKQAVLTTDGPLLVIAGAGSGKTRVLTTRIAYLIDNLGVNPYNILAITFTNKAAREMKERIIKMLGPKAFDMQISTFHSFGLKILKENYEYLGYKSNFTILDSDDVTSLIKKILKDLNLDSKIYNPKAIKNVISNNKNALIDASSFSKFVQTDFDEKALEVYKVYEKRMKVNNSLDFDDLLLLPIKLFKEHDEVLKYYQSRFTYVLVDEYQDINEAQYILTKLICSLNKNICVVGDESQAIYSWRGSDYRNILNFEKDYKEANVVLLEKNYRSTKTILNAANSVIKNNKNKKDKNLWTDNEVGSKINYHICADEIDEAIYVSDEIKNLIKNGENKKEIAVLYRTNAQSRNIEEMLLRESIPYKIVGSFYFYNRKEIKDLIAYLKLIYNKNDDVSLLRVINVPKRGIGEKTLSDISNLATSNNTSIYDAITSGNALKFKKVIDELCEIKDKLTLTELIDAILDKTGIRSTLESEKTVEADIRLENLEEFKTITRTFENNNDLVTLSDFLDSISLVSDVAEYKNNDDVVTLMTIHSAKGLEFNNVFIIGLEEGILPHVNSIFDADALEEERRLCYVAITRAKKRLWLVNAKRRMLYGASSYNLASRFIGEIDSDLLISNNSDNISSVVEEYSVGDKIVHNTFGEGVCIGIDKDMLTIAFKHPYGIKKIVMRHKSIRKEIV